MECSRCQAPNRDERRFCGECGAPLTIVCPSCGFGNEPAERFCGGCGRALGESPHRERRQVTVLFADVVGFTSMSERFDPEVVHEIMEGCFNLLSREVGRYGGRGAGDRCDRTARPELRAVAAAGLCRAWGPT